jgi:hypothetical protein
MVDKFTLLLGNFVNIPNVIFYLDKSNKKAIYLDKSFPTISNTAGQKKCIIREKGIGFLKTIYIL